MNSNSSNIDIGVIGGTGLYSIESLENVQEVKIETPYGRPSDLIRIGNISGTKVAFLARHGRHHSFLPTEIPYQANIWAMKSLGVKWIISVSAVGSLKKEIKPLDIVIPDQFIDRTKNRPFSFFGSGAVAHISMAQPFCPYLSSLLLDCAASLIPKDRKLHSGGTYLCMEGPAFSTQAESKLYQAMGCSVIGMTNHTEARLSKEAEIAYATLAMSTDYDCWHEEHDNVTVEMIVSNLHSNADLASKIICKAITKIGILRPNSASHNALKDALISQEKHVPAQTKEKLNLITQKYWKS